MFKETILEQPTQKNDEIVNSTAQPCSLACITNSPIQL